MVYDIRIVVSILPDSSISKLSCDECHRLLRGVGRKALNCLNNQGKREIRLTLGQVVVPARLGSFRASQGVPCTIEKDLDGRRQ